jgi:hypothetical protein
MIGPAIAIWELARKQLPVHTALFDVYRCSIGTRHETETLRSIYEDMPPADFSRDILQKSSGLHALRLPRCGWSDWGTPERIFESLRGTVDHRALVERLRRAGESAAATHARKAQAFTAHHDVA